jgi:hypothetical protein
MPAGEFNAGLSPVAPFAGEVIDGVAMLAATAVVVTCQVCAAAAPSVTATP